MVCAEGKTKIQIVHCSLIIDDDVSDTTIVFNDTDPAGYNGDDKDNRTETRLQLLFSRPKKQNNLDPLYRLQE